MINPGRETLLKITLPTFMCSITQSVIQRSHIIDSSFQQVNPTWGYQLLLCIWYHYINMTLGSLEAKKSSSTEHMGEILQLLYKFKLDPYDKCCPPSWRKLRRNTGIVNTMTNLSLQIWINRRFLLCGHLVGLRQEKLTFSCVSLEEPSAFTPLGDQKVR